MEDKLQILKVIVEEEGFTNAAEKLYKSQPSISRDIKTLEEKYQIKIFENTRKHIILTEEGRELYNYACQLAILDEQLQTKINQHKEDVKGKFVIGTSHTFGQSMLLDLTIYLQTKYPKLNIHIYVYNSADILSKLKDYSLDLGIIEKPVLDDKINSEVLTRDKLLLVKNKQTNQNLNQLRCYVRETGSGIRYYQDMLLQQLNLTSRKVVINDNQLILELVKQNMGFTILSNFSIKSFDEDYIVTNDLDLNRNFFVVSNKSRYKTNKYNTIVNEIKNYEFR
ncbi:LysR family transcriptional regulator [Mammaliicoccus sciuri]|uniref:LysR family transcriptional regulator n=1 Tax=Mammaliicoccus sciuri TaxID=1296 RepID=A0AAJ4SK48_MAMSC|nr:MULTISPECIES: LysR family transcriptional regulator [Mammaliicoccus]MBN4910325.1 LysR family transcriptional regulator [Staphylococcus sp. EG-SA-13]MCJ0915320.1 LysR family transcriptional regulator [Mammaliicoccus sciuri]MCJ0919239.1 LysR family transcriptional regulator [Mammaliicoccus sciuri]MCJ0943629.1 LysR family transcriptional regulator [Mammaliicoccus sciuri]MCJ0956989.1 LysR family transcriptional regulator [Mammaliicoccus sciuri]